MKSKVGQPVTLISSTFFHSSPNLYYSSYPFLFSSPLFYPPQQQQHSVGWLNLFVADQCLNVRGGSREQTYFFTTAIELVYEIKEQCVRRPHRVLGIGECWELLILSRSSRCLWWKPSLHEGSSEVRSSQTRLLLVHESNKSWTWTKHNRATIRANSFQFISNQPCLFEGICYNFHYISCLYCRL